MKTIIAYTDGGCRRNGEADAVGGVGVVLQFQDVDKKIHRREIKVGYKGVTNNKMEIQAVIVCLSALKEPCEVVIMSDSKYVCDAVNKKWIDSWVRKGWINSSKEPVKNKEQWEQLLVFLKMHKVSFFWVKGHSDNEENNRCDKLANEAMDEVEGGYYG